MVIFVQNIEDTVMGFIGINKSKCVGSFIKQKNMLTIELEKYYQFKYYSQLYESYT